VSNSGRPSVSARWLAAQRDRLEGTRPSTPTGDVAAEHRLYRGVAGVLAVPLGGGGGVATRTRIVDAEVALALGRGLDQIVLLGAGYDGRALRFGGRRARWFEVDLPPTQDDKRRRLAALGTEPAGVTYAGVDLMTGDLDAALARAGHDPDAPSLFVCERVLATLTLEATASVCRTLRARAAPASVLVATFGVAPAPSAPVRALRTAAGACRRAAGEPRRNDLRPGDPEKLMVVTACTVTRTESSAGCRLDPGSQLHVVVCEPG
jgi:methyltransferase (TIGR00027 family)